MYKEEILTKISRMQDFVNKGVIPCNERKKILRKLYQNIKLLIPEINEALKLDLNKSQEEAYMSEIGLVLSEISFMLKHISSYSRVKRVKSPIAQFPSTSYKLPSPYGKVLIISPWNYPFMLAIEPLVDAISAGNCVLIKPSEISPNTSKVIEKLINMTFEKGYVEVVQGGVDECTYLLDQDFDYIFFTGSTRVGKIVMQKAAEHFTPVTLELGGKSPCIVDETADIKLSAKRIIFGKLLNCGQTCVAPDYIYCHETIKDKLVEELSRQIILQYSVSPLDNKDYPRMINHKQFDAMSALIEQEKILFGGKTNKDSLKIEPTIVDADFDDEAMKNEIFGPILPIVTFKDINEVVERVNSLGKPLALYIFSKSKHNQQLITNRCQFGGGCINDTIIHIATP